MYLPPPLRAFREAIRLRQGVRRDRQELRAILDKSSALDLEFVKTAIKRTLSKPSSDEQAAFNLIERRRGALMVRTDTFQLVDYGAGASCAQLSSLEQQNTGFVTTATVTEAAHWSQPPLQASLLHYLVRAKRPNAVLEMGSCVGMSGSYMASALRINGRGHLWTIEGAPGVAKLAQETYRELDLDSYVTSIVGPFKDTLAPTLAAHGPFDLVFVDGHHDGDATIQYFNQIKSHVAPSCAIIFDDIDWSLSMGKAWETISADRAVKDAAVFARWGVVILR